MSVTRQSSTVALLSVLLCISVIIAGIILRFFGRPIIFAAVIGIGFYPLHEKIKKLIPRENASALLSTFLVLLMFVAMAGLLASAASGDIVRAAQYLGGKSGQGVTMLADLFRSSDRILAWLGKYVDLEKIGLRSAIDSLPARTSQLLLATGTAL